MRDFTWNCCDWGLNPEVLSFPSFISLSSFFLDHIFIRTKSIKSHHCLEYIVFYYLLQNRASRRISGCLRDLGMKIVIHQVTRRFQWWLGANLKNCFWNIWRVLFFRWWLWELCFLSREAPCYSHVKFSTWWSEACSKITGKLFFDYICGHFMIIISMQ